MERDRRFVQWSWRDRSVVKERREDCGLVGMELTEFFLITFIRLVEFGA